VQNNSKTTNVQFWNIANLSKFTHSKQGAKVAIHVELFSKFEKLDDSEQFFDQNSSPIVSSMKFKRNQ